MQTVRCARSSAPWMEYRKNKAIFHAVPPARVRPPPATLRPLVPTPGGGPPAPRCPPGAGLARACPEAPTPAAGPPCRAPAGHRGGRRSGRQRAGRRGTAPPLAHHLSPPRHRLRSSPAHQRAGAAAWRSQRWLALRGLGDGQAAPLGLRGGTDSNAMSLLKNAMSLLLKRPVRRSGASSPRDGRDAA